MFDPNEFDARTGPPMPRPKCASIGCNSNVQVISTDGTPGVCMRCHEEIHGTPTTLWEALKPRTSLREKLQNLLDKGKLRG